jgi:uncharacterized protein (DUF934 family)
MAREQVKRKKSAGPVEIARGVPIKDGARVEGDAWRVLDDDAPVPADGDVVVSLTRFQAERQSLFARNGGRLGLMIAPDDAVEDISEDLGEDATRFSLVMVQFPVFRDGRGFTSARLLRERYGYRGELRAVGEVLEDQIYFMLRCGFDAFEIVGSDPEAVFARAAKTFSAAYQPAADGLTPVSALRAKGQD